DVSCESIGSVATLALACTCPSGQAGREEMGGPLGKAATVSDGVKSTPDARPQVGEATAMARLRPVLTG
ncbi:hypothetical protein ACYTTR_19030, partial [Cobetia marina]